MSKEGDGNIRSFGALIQNLEDGQLLNDLGDKLLELNGKLAKQSAIVGKAKGELTLNIKLAADQGGAVQVDAEITMKEPKSPRARSVLWLTKDNRLANENPRQTKLPLREVPAPKEAREPRRSDEGAWEKLQKALRGTIDEDTFETLRGTRSLPFKPGKRAKIRQDR